MPIPTSQKPPPIEVYGFGTWQAMRDEVTYVCQTVEKLTNSNHKIEDSLDSLTNAIDSVVGILEEIRDELVKVRNRLEAKDH